MKTINLPKTRLGFFTLLALLMNVCMYSQAPALIPYQAIARDAAGQPLANTAINARFTIHDNSATGTSVWQEIQTVNTNTLGLFTAQLGSSIALSSVNWGSGAKFMQVEIDLGNGFVDIGTQQMLSVPYALYSVDALNAQNAQIAANGISSISLTGDTLYLSNGTYVIVPGISAANGGGNNDVPGCTNNTACNYNSSATQDDGTCYFIGSPCNDNNSNTFNDVYNTSCTCEGSTGTTGSAHSCGAANVHNPNLTYGSMTDQEGNIYKTIVIGTQEWMAENLNTSIYRNGDAIPTGLSNNEWLETINSQQGAYSYYNNDPDYACPYGKLYNWFACSDYRSLCPVGWHVPSNTEWITLTNFIGGDNLAASAMKSIGALEDGSGFWTSPNTGATNEYGFSALPGGFRDRIGPYSEIGNQGVWWSSTQYNYANYWIRLLTYFDQGVFSYVTTPHYGYGVRCLRD